MRERLRPYKGPNRLNFLCILATELLGETHLRNIPMLLSGFDSVVATVPPNVATAIRNLRLDRVVAVTESDVRLMVETYRHHHSRRNNRRQATRTEDVLPLWSNGPDDPEPTNRRRTARGPEVGGADVDEGDSGEGEDNLEARFDLDDKLNVRKRWTFAMPDDIKEAIRSLTTVLPVRQRAPRLMHDASQAATVRYDPTGFEATVEPIDFTPPVPVVAGLAHVGRAPGVVRWSDLVTWAERFDEMDLKAGRQQPGQRSWWRRLHTDDGAPTAQLLRTEDAGLANVDSLELSGIKHLIGLPGAGKTTMLYLLAAWMNERDYRVCFLFPSIEVATAFLETLGRYEISSALLFGQGDRARSKHVANFASAVGQDNSGFGVTRSTADFFATNCTLAGYASDSDVPFPHDRPPCDRVMQRSTQLASGTNEPRAKGRATKRQCALSSVCGRQFAERSLATSNVWAGHILSADRELSPLFSGVRLRQFEYLARTFDLVVVDECDGAQQNLDARGTPLLKLSGDRDSVWNRLLMDLHAPAAQGNNAFVAGANIPGIMAMSGRYGIAAERLTAAIIHARPELRKAMKDKLLTAISLLAEMYPDLDQEGDDWTQERVLTPQEREARRERHRQSVSVIETIWQAVAKRVAYRTAAELFDDAAEDYDDQEARGAPSEIGGLPGPVAWLGGRGHVARLSEICGASPETIEAYTQALYEDLDRWDRDATQELLDAIIERLRQAPGLTPLDEGARFGWYTQLLAHVSLLVLQHFGLAPHLRMLNAQGILGDDVFESRPSRELLANIPESLVGRLSGVRYTVGDEGDVDIAHVGVSGTPRLLVRRMLALGKENGGGPAILMTSATSFLEYSPSYHVNEGPHYVLRRPNAGDGWARSKYRFLPMRDPRNSKRALYFSGAKLSQRDGILRNIVDQLLAQGDFSIVESAIAANDVVDGVGRKAAFVVNSYDQCQLIYDHIRSHHPSWRARVRVLVRGGALADRGVGAEHAITASEVERLGDDNAWDLFIFPMSAIGRGVNIVFRNGPRAGQAMVGSLFFLTRPHPKTDSMSFLQGIVARASERFDARHFASREEALGELRRERAVLAFKVRQLLRMTQAARALGPYAEEFVADLMIMILQTIGRTMRGDCPAFVYFVDAAWAPLSAIGQRDDASTSTLLMMRDILGKCLTHPQPAIRECYENLYRTFLVPLCEVQDVIEEPATQLRKGATGAPIEVRQ